MTLVSGEDDGDCRVSLESTVCGVERSREEWQSLGAGLQQDPHM